MQFVADENIDWPIIERLRADGHIVYAVVEQSPGITDPNVLAIANQQNAVLLTVVTATSVRHRPRRIG